MIGSYAYRFETEEDALKALDTVIDPDTGVVDENYRDVLLFGEVDLEQGYWVFVTTVDGLGVDGWEKWITKPDKTRHVFAGLEDEQEICMDKFGKAQKKVPVKKSPVKVSKNKKARKSDAELWAKEADALKEAKKEAKKEVKKESKFDTGGGLSHS